MTVSHKKKKKKNQADFVGDISDLYFIIIFDREVTRPTISM